MEEQVDYCNIKSFDKRPCKASCSTSQSPLTVSEANKCCVQNLITLKNNCNGRKFFLNSEKAAQSESSCHSQNPTTPKIISKFSWNRSSSLPPIAKRDSSFKPQFEVPTPQLQNCNAKVPLSTTVPVRNVVIVRSTSMPCQRQHDSVRLEVNQNDEEIREDEAVCRICLVPLNEGGSWLRMQCSCKGDLRLLHKECAIKWFSIKGNTKCDVCGNNVADLPVTLVQVPNGTQSDIDRPSVVQEVNSEVNLDRVFSDLIMLSLMSSLCYFFFILQLLATKMKHNAIMIAAPFSLTLGILGSIMSVTSACRKHTWAYSAFQFTSVAVFLSIFLSVLQLDVALAIIFASFVGLGLAAGLNSLCRQIIAWRIATIQARRNVTLA